MASPKTKAKNAKLADMFPPNERWLVVGKQTYRNGHNAAKRLIALTRKLHRAHVVSMKAEARRRKRQQKRALDELTAETERLELYPWQKETTA